MCLGRTTASAGRTLDNAAATQVPPRPEKQPPPLSVRGLVFHAPQDCRSARGGRLGDVRWSRSLGTTRVPRFARRCVPRADRRTRARNAVRSDLRVRHALVHHAVLRRITVDVADGDRRLSPRAARPRPAAPAVPAARAATYSIARSWREALRYDSWTGGASRVADRPATGPLHRGHDPGRGRNRQDVRLHVPVCRPTAPLESGRSGAQARWPCPGSEGRFLWPGPIDAPPDRP